MVCDRDGAKPSPDCFLLAFEYFRDYNIISFCWFTIFGLTELIVWSFYSKVTWSEIQVICLLNFIIISLNEIWRSDTCPNVKLKRPCFNKFGCRMNRAWSMDIISFKEISRKEKMQLCISVYKMRNQRYISYEHQQTRPMKYNNLSCKIQPLTWIKMQENITRGVQVIIIR